MDICFISDTHADQLLVSGTTPQSRGKLRLRRHRETMKVFMDGYTVHAGDIFHGSNPRDGAGLSYALQQAAKCDVLLAGNHDVANESGRHSAFQSLIHIDSLQHKIREMQYGVFGYLPFHEKGICIPHVGTQELFEQSIAQACEDKGGQGYILLLHCNIAMSDSITNETTLNLTDDLIKEVSENFVRTFVGHKHQYKEYNGGSVVSIGTPFPTSFADLNGASKGFGYVTYDIEKDDVQFHCTNTLASLYREIDVDQLISAESSNSVGHVSDGLPCFVKVIGDFTHKLDMVKWSQEFYNAGVLAISWDLNHAALPLTESDLEIQAEEGDSAVGVDVVKEVLQRLPEEHKPTVSALLGDGYVS